MWGRQFALLAVAATMVSVGPLKEMYALSSRSHKDVLRLDAIGNGTGFTPIFHVPVKSSWGLAWRYRCRCHPAEYDMVVWEVVNAVDLAYTSIFAHGKRGSGYRMETGETSNIMQPNGKQAGIILAIHVRTTCQWHIRVIAGTEPVVRRWVPRFVTRSSWTP